MFCTNCGKEGKNGDSFCTNCGKKFDVNCSVNSQSVSNSENNFTNVSNVNNVNSVDMSGMTVNNSVNNMSNSVPNGMSNYYPNSGYVNNVNTDVSNSKNNSNNKLIIILALVVIVLVAVIGFIVFGNSSVKNRNVETRTVLIYLCGSDLESGAGLATSDLESIKPEEIDLDKINVVVYTGGSKEWHNYVSSDENAIYVLTENGFEKKEAYTKSSMGSASSLSTFLDYVYENYQADKYDLVMWNHGLGALGISSDEVFNHDYLSLNELTKALQNSNFKDDNKFETVVFRSCLNSTIEMASVFLPYSNYFVASEEITYGVSGSDVLSFINELELEDDGIETGKKFILAYEKSLKRFAESYNQSFDDVFPVSTYAIVDLSKLTSLQNNLNAFFDDINLDLNYNTIAKVRSNLYQYASSNGSNSYGYDTIDLYHLIQELQSLSTANASNLLSILNEAIVYNWSNNDFSTGLSIYFPYRGDELYRSLHFNYYKNLSGLSSYYSFIKKFDTLQEASGDGGFSTISKADIEISIENKQLTLKLHDEDVDNYAKASYIIFEKNVDNTFTPVFTSNTFELSQSSYVMNLDEKLVKVIESSQLININEEIGGYSTDVVLVDDDGEYNAKVYFDSNMNMTRLMLKNENNLTGLLVNINDYSAIKFIKNSYNILNNNEVVDNWEDSLIENSIEVRDYSIEKIDLDSNYYVMFKIYDVDNLYTYSDLVQIK